MLLVGQYDSPFVRRVAVSLHWLGIPFTRDTKSVFTDAAEMRKINPLGRVPALILDDGETLIDSAAILDHLDELVGPKRALLPRQGATRRNALRTIAIATGAMDKAVAIVYERLLRPPAARHQPWVDRCQIQIKAALDVLERQPLDKQLANGRTPQSAFTAACLVGFLNLRVPDAFLPVHYPALARLSAQAEALPAFKAARSSDADTAPGAVKV